MCPTAVCDNSEIETKVGLPEMGRGGRKGAKARRLSFESPTPEAASPLLTPKIKHEEEEEDDDLLAGLSLLFKGVQLEDSDDDSESEPDEAPRSPASKGIDHVFIGLASKRTYFYALGHLYFYDDDHNVYLDNSPNQITLEHVGQQFTLEGIDMFTPAFFIGGVAYYFDGVTGELMCKEQGTLQPVVTWVGESNQTLNQALSQTFVPSATVGATFWSNNPITFELEPYKQATVFKEAKHPPWSPGSSTLSPIVPSGSRASSVGFEPVPAQGYVDLWAHQVKVAQAERGPSSNKMDRRKCPLCNKTFRRPSSLEDHLNVHSGNKPHVCPFKECNTGFATKSNMKRHFLTHRVDTTVEDYRVGKVGKSKSRSLTTTYNSKAFHTQRFRLST